MVVCKFFQQGNCRFGQACRFEHIYGSKYTYHAPTQQVTSQATSSSVTDEQLINQVQSDVQGALKGGQWLLSCYAPFKEKPIVPGITDLSPEEARLFIYEAKANNNIDAAVAFINKQMQETRMKYEQLLQPTSSMIKVLRSLYNGEPVQWPSTTPSQDFGSNNAATSIFRGAVQNTGFTQSAPNTSIFGQSNTTAPVFGNQQPSSIFGSPSDPAKSIFASATQNVFGAAQTPSLFQTQNQDAAKSIFSQATQNVFGQAQPTNPAPMNVFAQSQNTFQQSDVFKQNPGTDVFSTGSQPGSVFQISDRPTTNVFGTVNNESSFNINEDMIYSKVEELSPSDIQAYESPAFKLGFVPELPPPANLCR